MALDVKKAEYCNITVGNHTGEGAKLLPLFADVGINLLGFKAVPLESGSTRFSLFPDESSKMTGAAKKAGLELDGPHSAIIVKGFEDDPGTCADIFVKLSKANINAIEASGIADIRESYGVILYLKEEDCEKALAALKG
jgi:hypothetical protein